MADYEEASKSSRRQKPDSESTHPHGSKLDLSKIYPQNKIGETDKVVNVYSPYHQYLLDKEKVDKGIGGKSRRRRGGKSKRRRGGKSKRRRGCKSRKY